MKKIPYINAKEIIYHKAGEQMPVNTSLQSQICPAVSGDFLLVKGKTNDLFSKAIRFGQMIRGGGKFAGYTHAAIFVDNYGNLLEAVSQGVRTAFISKYLDYDFVIVKVNASDADRTQAVIFAKACENDGYGWTTLVSIAFSLLTGLKFSFGFDGEEICSGLVASCLFMMGQWMSHDPSHTTPSELARNYLTQFKT